MGGGGGGGGGDGGWLIPVNVVQGNCKEKSEYNKTRAEAHVWLGERGEERGGGGGGGEGGVSSVSSP